MFSELSTKWLEFMYGLNAFERGILVYATLGAGALLFMLVEKRRRTRRK